MSTSIKIFEIEHEDLTPQAQERLNQLLNLGPDDGVNGPIAIVEFEVKGDTIEEQLREQVQVYEERVKMFMTNYDVEEELDWENND